MAALARRAAGASTGIPAVCAVSCSAVTSAVAFALSAKRKPGDASAPESRNTAGNAGKHRPPSIRNFPSHSCTPMNREGYKFTNPSSAASWVSSLQFTNAEGDSFLRSGTLKTPFPGGAVASSLQQDASWGRVSLHTAWTSWAFTFTGLTTCGHADPAKERGDGREMYSRTLAAQSSATARPCTCGAVVEDGVAFVDEHENWLFRLSSG